MLTKTNRQLQLRETFRSSLRSAKARKSAKNSADSSGAFSLNTDSFSRSSGKGVLLYGRRAQLSSLGQTLKKLQAESNSAVNKKYSSETDTPEVLSKRNFELLGDIEERMNSDLSKSLKKAGVPEDVTFEYDYDINSGKAEITQISDERYREKIETVLNKNTDMSYIAFASRVMNGNIASAYYPDIAQSLKSFYGQNIANLYVDGKGNLCGANSKLQKAISDSKRGTFNTNPEQARFPANNIEGIVKRLVSDKNITPNVSHMGYSGGRVYTNDGEFKFGKDFDKSLLNEKRYTMRGSIALLGQDGYDRWLADEKLF